MQLVFFQSYCARVLNPLSNLPSCTETQTRMQGTQASQYASTFDCFKQVLSKEGAGAFYAGIIPRLGRVVPGQGIIFMSFETIVENLEKFAIFQ